mmetsp:Transcript_15939/g.16684  ORF Transcript_15939/g.16684 Transcript_15939/m.16684 type:complete len:198 (+) Transcript_15939:116-709(+)
MNYSDKEIVGYIIFEPTSMKTFIIHAVILLFSLGALTVLMTPEDEENNHHESKKNQNKNDFSNIVVIDTVEEVQINQEIKNVHIESVVVKEEIIQVPVLQPTVSFSEELSTVVVSELPSSPPPLTTSTSTGSNSNSISNSSFTEQETTTLDSIKATPKRRAYKNREVSPPSSPPMSPTRRSDRKIKKPEYFEPARKR